MISLIRPLGVNLVFEDRPYSLGETVNVMMEVSARRDVEVREGRVELQCEERYEETSTVMTLPAGAAAVNMRRNRVELVLVPEKAIEQRTRRYVHSSTVFLSEERLFSDSPCTYVAKLKVRPEPPPHSEEARVRWQLVATVRPVRAPGVSRKRKVSIIVPGRESVSTSAHWDDHGR